MDSLLEQLMGAWLTEILRAEGHLDRGQVTRVEVVQVFETPPSFHARLRLSYSIDALAEVPPQIFLKSPKPHKLARGKREIDFYTRLAPSMPDALLLSCYAADWNPATGESFLLLADVSATHFTADLPLSWSQLEVMAQTLAQIHARWWEHPDLVALVGEAPETYFAVDFAECERYYVELQQNLGDQLTPSQRRMFEEFLAHGPDLILPRLDAEPSRESLWEYVVSRSGTWCGAADRLAPVSLLVGRGRSGERDRSLFERGAARAQP